MLLFLPLKITSCPRETALPKNKEWKAAELPRSRSIYGKMTQQRNWKLCSRETEWTAAACASADGPKEWDAWWTSVPPFFITSKSNWKSNKASGHTRVKQRMHRSGSWLCVGRAREGGELVPTIWLGVGQQVHGQGGVVIEDMNKWLNDEQERAMPGTAQRRAFQETCQGVSQGQSVKRQARPFKATRFM